MLGETGAATAVKLLLCVNLMLTFPIVCRSAFLIIEGLFERQGVTLGTLQQRALRGAFVVAASGLGTSIPSFGALLGLVAGLSLSMIALVFPAWIALAGRAKGDGAPLVPMSGAEKALAAAIGAVGVAISAFTVVAR